MIKGTTEIEDRNVRRFLEQLKKLYSFIEEFCREYGLRCRYSDLEIYEEFAGKYKAKELYVYSDGDLLFKLKPIGAHIIAADGRVDLIGKFEERRLVFLSRPYELQTEIKIDGRVIERKVRPLYKGFEKEGWYVSLEGGKIRLLNKATLCQILEEVSEFRCPTKNKAEI